MYWTASEPIFDPNCTHSHMMTDFFPRPLMTQVYEIRSTIHWLFFTSHIA